MKPQPQIFDIDLRDEARVDGLAKSAKFSLSSRLYRNEAYLLVHGFNVDRYCAKHSYNKFQQNLLDLSFHFPKHKLANHILDVTWPGDLKTKAHYHLAVRNAKKASTIFAEAIKALSKYKCKRLYIIGHPLGCRLILESLMELDESKWEQLKNISVVFMAAAINEKMLLRDHKAIKALESIKNTATYYSDKDYVLKVIFRVANPFKGQALGYSGEPSDMFDPRQKCVGLAIQTIGKSVKWLKSYWITFLVFPENGERRK